jgi:hypothetical protein
MPPPPRYGGRLWATLASPRTAAVAAFLLRAVASLVLRRWHHPDVYEQDAIVRHLLHGEGLTYDFLGTTYHSFHSNLPTDGIIAAVYLVTGESQFALLIAQWLGAAGLAIVLGRLGLRVGGSSVASAAAWLAATHPALIVYDATKLQQISFDALFVALLVLAFVRWAERPSRGRAAAAGVLAAIVLYERGSIAPFLIAGVLWVGRTAPLDRARWMRQTTVFGLVALAIVAPWMIRNTIVHGRFIALTTQTGLMLWKGNHADATGTEFTADGTELLEALPPELHHRVFDVPSELGQLDAFGAAGARYVREHPFSCAWLFVKKLGMFWWRSAATGRSYTAWWTGAYQAWYLALLALAAVGAVVARRAGGQAFRVAILLLLLGATFSAGQALLYIAGRHRFTIEPTLALLSALGLVRMVRASLPAIRSAAG